MSVLCALALAASAVADPGELFPGATSSHSRPDPRPTPPVESFPAIARPTPAQIGTATQLARKTITDFAAKNKLHLTEIPTDHFLLFSDCGRENDHIAHTLETTYASLTAALGIAPSDSVFLGRLPVVVLAHQAALRPYADRDGVSLADGAIGYSTDATDNPFAHIVMARALPTDAEEAEAFTKAWSSALSRELTRAILLRHRTARPLPTWLTAGLAEHAAPTPLSPEDAAKPRPELKSLLSPPAISPEHAPACGTFIDLLLARDPKAFAEFVRALKTGTPLATAFDRCLKLDAPKLEALWKAAPPAATATPTTAPGSAG